MKKVPVLSTDEALNNGIRKTCEKFAQGFIPIVFSRPEDILAYLEYELPDVSILNFNDPSADAVSVIKEVKADNWLHYGGIIVIHNSKDKEWLQNDLRGTNTIAIIHRKDFHIAFPRLMRILKTNRRFLFQRDIQAKLLEEISGSFVIDNDPFDVKTYANLIKNFLYNLNFINQEIKNGLQIALQELLMNAIEHGNCSISFQEKTDWMMNGGDIISLVRKKNEDPDIRNKKVHFSYSISPERSTFTIRDEGAGFDWHSFVEPSEEEPGMEFHGRGIIIASGYVDSLRYNAAGNEVQFSLEHLKEGESRIPQALKHNQESVFKDGEIVFSEGEESNYLYYIASGKFAIYSEGKLVSTLTPDDIFMGEMSFLLNDKRSATVRSVGTSVLLKISQEDFIHVIKDNPHYGIILARLLAQRLERLNRITARIRSSNR